MTEGVLLFVEGSQAEGKEKILEGAKQNAPDKLTEFAGSLETLSHIPGADSYMGPVREIIVLLSAIGKEREKEEAMKRAQAQAAEDAKAVTAKPVATKRKLIPASADGPVVDVDLDEEEALPSRPPHRDLLGGTVVPAVENGAEPCQIGAFVATLSPTAGVCIKAATGPLIVSDLHASGACQADLFILGGSTEGTRWLMHSPAKTPLHVTGGRLLVRSSGTLTVAIVTKTRADVRCAVTWSGERE